MTSPAAARSGAEIQTSLRELVSRWRDYAGGEREEAQSFLNELIACYGVDRFAAGMRFEYHLPGVGFIDMFWPGRALVEMRALSRSQQLELAQPQAERYWRASEAPDCSYDAVRYIVLCSFHRVLIWDMRRPSRPAANLALDELPDHYEALLFLAGENVEASFVEHHRVLTRDAAEAVALLYQSLKDRGAAPLDEIQRFTMQCVWTMFAEDLGMIGEFPLQHIVERLRREEEPNSARDLGFLFRVLNQKGNQNRTGELAGTRYVNGELFEQPAEVSLNHAELALLARAAEYDWRRVDPTIFGSLMEGVLGRERRWKLGAHWRAAISCARGLGLGAVVDSGDPAAVYADVRLHDLSVARRHYARAAGGSGRFMSPVAGPPLGTVPRRERRAHQAVQRDGRGRVRRPQGAASRARRGGRGLLRLAEVDRAGRR